MAISLKITNLSNPKLEDGLSSPLSEEVFGCTFNEALVHQVVVAYMAASRAGTAAQKSRSEVSGSGKKPWKQKGTGRARSGALRSPIWRGGGVAFAAKTSDYSQKVNKKMYSAAMRSIFSELLRQSRLVLVENFDLVTHKTKSLLDQLQLLGLEDVLIVSDKVDNNLYLASRNLCNVGVCDPVAIDPVSLINCNMVVLTIPALQQIEKMFKKKAL